MAARTDLSSILLTQPPLKGEGGGGRKKTNKKTTLKCLKMCKQALTSARIQNPTVFTSLLCLLQLQQVRAKTMLAHADEHLPRNYLTPNLPSWQRAPISTWMVFNYVPRVDHGSFHILCMTV